ncbi:hypothetical protein EDB86DRAFT_727717 [Lactarius hatsudake]|nr:hypothetical protein EDB86DRAFT_727717 [Lactarius hatsudake]
MPSSVVVVILSALHNPLRAYQETLQLGIPWLPINVCTHPLECGSIKRRGSVKWKRGRAQRAPFVNTLDPSLRLWSKQVRHASSDGIEAEGHHIIGHCRVWATCEPPSRRLVEKCTHI